jgi:macrodomain Ter protein organizer (MatP/YcbG family)
VGALVYHFHCSFLNTLIRREVESRYKKNIREQDQAQCSIAVMPAPQEVESSLSKSMKPYLKNKLKSKRAGVWLK